MHHVRSLSTKLCMLQERGEGTESACRNRSKEENLAIWNEMKAGSEAGKKNCLRFRMDMANPNKALRDPTAARCNPTHHWRTGHKYKVTSRLSCSCEGPAWTCGASFTSSKTT